MGWDLAWLNYRPRYPQAQGVEEMSEQPKSLAEALPREMVRVASLLHYYDEIPTGIFAATMIRQDLKDAEKAIAEGNLAEMIRVYKILKETEA